MAQKQYSEQTGREEALAKEVQELESKVQGQYDDIVMLEREVEKLRKEKQASSGPCGCQAYRDLEEKVATMPVIPKAVAIAIFREGMAYGAGGVCDELDNAADIHIEETGYTGPFEVSFSQHIDLDDYLDTDYLRSKAIDNCDEEWVVDCLKNLCADNKFECRIHGVDDQEEKKND
jgi:FtsZ-binding cell division protein ZapB